MATALSNLLACKATHYRKREDYVFWHCINKSLSMRHIGLPCVATHYRHQQHCGAVQEPLEHSPEGRFQGVLMKDVCDLYLPASELLRLLKSAGLSVS